MKGILIMYLYIEFDSINLFHFSQSYTNVQFIMQYN